MQNKKPSQNSMMIFDNLETNMKTEPSHRINESIYTRRLSESRINRRDSNFSSMDNRRPPSQVSSVTKTKKTKLMGDVIIHNQISKRSKVLSRFTTNTVMVMENYKIPVKKTPYQKSQRYRESSYEQVRRKNSLPQLPRLNGKKIKI